MTVFFKVTAIGVITLLLVLIIKQYKSEYALAVSLAGGAVMLFIICSSAVGYISALRGYLSNANVPSESVTAVLKAVGIGYITEFCAATARDFGQSSLSAKIVFAGKLAVLSLALPFINQLVRIAVSFIE